MRHLERFRHTLYPDVANRVEALLEGPQLKGKADLVIDTTGVGPAVSDIFSKRGRSFKAALIHGGDAETLEEGTYKVPKRNLVSALQAALQTGTLKIASSLELAELLRKELLNFRIKINIATGHTPTSTREKATTTTWFWPRRWPCGRPGRRSLPSSISSL